MNAEQLANELDRANPEDIKHSLVLKTALEKYIKRCDPKIIAPWLRPKTREESGSIANFFRSLQAKSDSNRKGRSVNYIVRAVKTIENQTTRSLHIASGFWNRPRLFTGSEQTRFSAEFIVKRYMLLEETSEEADIAKRFLLLFINHGIESHRNDGELLAIDRFAARTGDSVDAMKTCNSDARPFREMARRFGLGILFLMGCRNIHMWRHISNDDIDWIFQYCQNRFQIVFAKVKELNTTAKSVVTDGLKAFGLDTMDRTQKTTLQWMFERDCNIVEAPHAPDAMDTLAAAAASAARINEGDLPGEAWNFPSNELAGWLPQDWDLFHPFVEPYQAGNN